MNESRGDFRPFGVDSRARPCRFAFLLNPDECPPELLDSLFEVNFKMWGGRLNPLIPVRGGEISERFWSLLKYADPDVIYTYVPLSQNLIDRIDREIVPFRIQAHPPNFLNSSPPIYSPTISEESVQAALVRPLLMSPLQSFSISRPTLLTYLTNWKQGLNDRLMRFVMRNFGIVYENAIPLLPDDWERLSVQNDWTIPTLFTHVAGSSNLVFPFQASEAYSVFSEPAEPVRDEYCIVVGESIETWLYFWNRVFLLSAHLRSRWHTLCLSSELLNDDSFIGPLREFLRRFTHRSGNNAPQLSLQSFELSEEELSQMKKRIWEGLEKRNLALDVRPTMKRLARDEFPVIAKRDHFYSGWRPDATTHQQGTSRDSLLSPPRSPVPLDHGTWVMDLRIEYVPRFSFYANEILSWKLPRRVGVAQAFFPYPNCRIDGDYSVSVAMRNYGPFKLRIPDENEIFHRAAGVMERRKYDENLKETRVIRSFARMGPSDKALYLNGILELYEGLYNAGEMFHSSFWRGIFERLARRGPKTEKSLFERVKNKLTKNKRVIASQLAVNDNAAIEWLSDLVIKLAREQQPGREEYISFTELANIFQEQRERFIAVNPDFRQATSPGDIERDQEKATNDLLGMVQYLTNSGIFLQGIHVRCKNCGSRFWREIGTLEQKVKCEGCSYTATVQAEAEWRYRLNSLVRNGIALHGSVPVICALCELRKNARESFIYTHGVELFRNPKDERPQAEVDILCISDGLVVCGEVKSSANEFTVDELEKLAKAALDLEADQVAIFAFNDTGQRLEKAREQLAALVPPGCAAVICRLSPRAFAAQPSVL